MPDKLRLLVCSHFAEEARAALAGEAFADVDIVVFPARCGRPPLTWDEVAALTPSNDAALYLLGGTCLAQLGPPPPTLPPSHIDQATQCFNRVLNPAVVDSYVQAGAYLMTPAWLRQWSAHIAAWGFDRAQAREFFAETITRLALLDTGIDPQSAARLAACAAFVARPYEQVPVGLDYFRLTLERIVLAWRLDNAQAQAKTEAAQAQQQLAEYAMILDLMGMLARFSTEDEAIQNIFALFTGLFAPAVLAYAPWQEGALGTPRIFSAPSGSETARAIDLALAHFDTTQKWAALDRGFILRLTHAGRNLGLLLVDEVAFPEYERHYLNLALSIADVCGLALHNARAYRQIDEARRQLQDYNERLEQLVQDKVQELELERAKFLQSAKLAAIGEMATGVAHELNQPLTAMLFDANYLQTIVSRARESEIQPVNLDELADMAQGLTQDIDRCRRIIDHLRDFGRAAPQTACKTDLNQVIHDSLILTRERLKEHNIELRLDLREDLPPLWADSHKLEQVFLNLISNAEYALRERQRRLEAMEAMEGTRPAYHKVLEIATEVKGASVAATIHDNGCGISAEAQAHMFEPFFTTKPLGEGTGLGMSISYGIVTEFGGHITFESAENVGTTFTVQFPAAT